MVGVLVLMLPTWLGVVLCTFALVAWHSRRRKGKMTKQPDHPG
jgi:heme/copper-type cytochrome/quinol oxidase subunit 2